MRARLTILSITFALLLAACGGDGDTASPEDTSSPGTVETQTSDDGPGTPTEDDTQPQGALPEPRDVTFAIIPASFSPLGIFVAQDMGYFERYGLNVEFINAQSGSAMAQAMAAGEADFTLVHATSVQNLNQAGNDVGLVVGQFEVLSGDLICQPDIDFGGAEYPEVMEQLAGRTVAITSPGSATDTHLRYTLIAAGVDPADVEIVGVGGVGNLISSFRSGNVDCETAFLPVQHILREESQSIVNWMGGEGPPELQKFQFNSVGTTTAFAEENPDVVLAMEAAMREMIEFASDPANAAEIAAAIQHNFGDEISEEELTGLVEEAAPTFNANIGEDNYEAILTVQEAIGDPFTMEFEELLVPPVRE